jgi:hypothetical protein
MLRLSLKFFRRLQLHQRAGKGRIQSAQWHSYLTVATSGSGGGMAAPLPPLGRSAPLSACEH